MRVAPLPEGAYLDTDAHGFTQDPHPIFDALRPAGPVVRDRIGWSTLDYATSDAAFHDVALSPGIDDLLARQGIGHLWGEPGHTLTDSEGAAHQRLRRAVSPWFSARRVTLLRERTEQLVAQLLDDVGPRDGLDAMAQLADVVPARLFCWMIGAPDADAPTLARLSKALLSVFTATEAMVAPVRAAKAELTAYTQDLLDARRAASRAGRATDDLAGVLTVAADTGQIDHGDEFFLLEELLSASVDNTANTTALALLTLAEHPEAWRTVHERPDQLRSAIEECGRYEPAIRHTIKVATAPTVVGGQAIEAGEFVTVRIAAAHRDPAAFPDPHRFDITRDKPQPQLAFGAGRHYCLGAALARMEVYEMLRGLTARWPAVRIGPADLDRYTSGIVRSLHLQGEP
jgi:cytochrome P450